MDFTNLNQIIDYALSWFFTTEMLATPTLSLCVNLSKFVLGFLAIYFIGIFPFVISYRCIIRDWRVKK